MQLGCIKKPRDEALKKMAKRNMLMVALLLTASLVLLFPSTALLYSKQLFNPGDKIRVFVSILPQAYFVERVGGERVDVSVMVAPGYSPATYEPRPKQMAELNKARLYFRIGVPFENLWIEPISKANLRMKVIDTRRGIALLPMKAHYNSDGHEGRHDYGKSIKDPHIWLSLRLVKVQAQNICDALIETDPAHRAYYKNNLKAFQSNLDKLDAEITEVLKDLKIRKFMVFHPAWGYFARDYGLEQIPIEVEGKEPSAKALDDLIKNAKQERIKVIFVQRQFSTKNAETVARSIGARVVRIDPMAMDYLENMRKIAETFRKVIQ
jgi:zinc transport system substrate-binding protein